MTIEEALEWADTLTYGLYYEATTPAYQRSMILAAAVRELKEENGRQSHTIEMLHILADQNHDRSEAAEKERDELRNKLNIDSQNFQIECHKAEIELLRAENAALRMVVDAARLYVFEYEEYSIGADNYDALVASLDALDAGKEV